MRINNLCVLSLALMSLTSAKEMDFIEKEQEIKAPVVQDMDTA